MQIWEWITGLYDQLRWIHTAEGISLMIASGGLIVLTIIIFVETGLLIGLFLPGDSLLITAGVLANPLNPHFISTLDIVQMNIVLAVAAILGDQTGYYLGAKMGDRIWQKPDSKLYKRKHLVAAQAFYQKYGGPSVVAARYMPIIRTFVPFVAGVARMPYRKFVFWNIAGGILWITSLLWIGYYLGATQFANRLDKLIVLVIFISVLPMILKALQSWLKKPGKAT